MAYHMKYVTFVTIVDLRPAFLIYERARANIRRKGGVDAGCSEKRSPAKFIMGRESACSADSGLK